MTKALTEKKNDLITRAETVLNQAKEEQRELTNEEVAEMTEIRSSVERIDATMKLDDDFKKYEINEANSKEENAMEEKRELDKETMERNAFENFLRNKIVHERTGELSPAQGSGEALIPTTIVNYIIKKVYDISPVLERSQKFNVKGNLEVPYYPADSDNITVDYRSEFSALSSTSGGFDTVTLGGFLAGALTKVSRSLMNNVDFDIVGFVVDEMAEQIARFIEKELLVGTSQKVTGLSTLQNAVVASSASAITLDEIIELHDAIKDRFQQNAIWIMSPKTRTVLRQMTSLTGYPLLNDDISTPFGASILGKPVYVSDNMPDIGAGEDVIYYGDLRGLATKFSEDINIEVLRERFADEHAVGVIGWFEFDAKVIDEQQIAKLTMAGGSK